jgi:hypothetical protein
MNEYDFKSPIIVLAICMLIGMVADYFLGLFWLGLGFLAFSFLLFIGLMEDSDSRSEGALYDSSNETHLEKINYKKAVRVHKAIIFISLLCAGTAFYLN